MSWAKHAIEKLLAGETVQIRPKGNSMSGKIESGDLVTLEPYRRYKIIAVDGYGPESYGHGPEFFKEEEAKKACENKEKTATFSVIYPLLEKDDIVLVKVKGRHYVHLIQAVQQKMGGIRYQIGNNRGGTNGWVSENALVRHQ